jgi:hypothetical protein
MAVPSVAHADMGLPMIFLAWPGMGVMLVPVIALEVAVLMSALVTPLKRTAVVATVSNVISTVVGVPVTWVILVALQFLTGGGGAVGPDFGTLAGKIFAVTWQAPWLLPYESDLYWMIPVAMLVLLVPFFFASWLIEYPISRLMMRKLQAGVVRRGVLGANLVSYGLLALVVLGVLGVAIYQHGGR